MNRLSLLSANFESTVNDVLGQANRDTSELRKFWVFLANPGVQKTFTVKMSCYCTK